MELQHPYPVLQRQAESCPQFQSQPQPQSQLPNHFKSRTKFHSQRNMRPNLKRNQTVATDISQTLITQFTAR